MEFSSHFAGYFVRLKRRCPLARASFSDSIRRARLAPRSPRFKAYFFFAAFFLAFFLPFAMLALQLSG